MASTARPLANPKGPNPTSSAYAAQRGSVDMLMKVKPASAPAKSAPTGIQRGPAASGTADTAPKMSFLEAVRAQRQEKAQMVRNNGGGPSSSTITTTTITNANAFGKVPKAGGFSALLAGKAAAPSKAAPATTTTTTTTTISTSFAEVQDELEAGFQRYSRANPLGGVGTTFSSGKEEAQDANAQHKGQATTATSRNLKARQLMVAPMAKNERQNQQQLLQQQQRKQQQQKNNGGDSSDEDMGRSALGRSKRARKG